MATVPTGKLEAQLRKLYLQWVSGLPDHEDDIENYIEKFRQESTALIAQLGGDAARQGALAGFPAPREIPLDPNSVAKIFTGAQQAAVRSGIATGLNAKLVARSMFKAGMGQSYHQLERLARTETVRAYWNNAWDSIDGLDLVMVWSAEDGPRTCPYCKAKDGLVVQERTIQDHPSGRCTLLPTLPGRVKNRVPISRQYQSASWDGSVPSVVDQQLGRGMDHALVASRDAQTAITGMVSQGWTSADASRYFLTRSNIPLDSFTREERSQIMRAMESYADELTKKLKPIHLPETLYRGGTPNGTGLSSWSANQSTAELYAIRNTGGVYAMSVPRGLYAYQLPGNTAQAEYLVLASPRLTGVAGTTSALKPIHRGSLDGHTIYRTVDTALSAFPKEVSR